MHHKNISFTCQDDAKSSNVLHRTLVLHSLALSKDIALTLKIVGVHNDHDYFLLWDPLKDEEKGRSKILVEERSLGPFEC